MAEVKILVEGYETVSMGEETACSTITLVRDKNIIIIVDPGALKNQKILVDALRKEGLTVNDVNFVCITHSHLDHYKNISIFQKASFVDYSGLWYEDKFKEWDTDDIRLSDNIRIVKTPGHNYDNITLLVKTKEGVVAICGDVFWKENYPKDDRYATDKKELEKSRKKVLQLADWIVPGHGGMYKVKKVKT
ncbi:MAG: MBL fold metallo-hydrolase [Candidatus Aenigmarchaeota archaeon]|nr:MBL fold metallo-hydrolase [Candidatus Aenigmarchaeota archaeon]